MTITDNYNRPVAPSQRIIFDAENIARRSPCVKSKRGVLVVVRGVNDDYVSVSQGWNSMPSGMTWLRNGSCQGTDECRKHCSKRCVHAEMRALRDIPGDGFMDGVRAGLLASVPTPFALEMVHVKIDDTGHIVAGGPPSCWQCSREIVDDGRIRYVWLYQHLLETVVAGVTDDSEPFAGAAPDPRWCRYTPEQFHVETLRNCGLLPSPSDGRSPAYIGDA